MTTTQIKALPDKYRPVFLGLMFLCFSLFASGQTYNSSVCCTVSNKSYGAAQAVSTDGRSWFYDATNFVMRDYNGTTEAFSYLNLPKYRSGHFPIFVHTGGILQSNGVWLGGSTLVYWFKDSTGNANLVRWYTDSASGCTSCLQIAANLSDLNNAATARTNIGLGNVDNTSDATKNAASVSLTNHTINGNLNTLSNISNGSLSNSTIGLTLTATGSDVSIPVTPASLGSNLTINIPTATGSVRGVITGADWSSFHNKVDSTSQSNDSVYDWHNGTATFRYLQAGAGTGISSLNGLTASTQFFATGTAGSDFNIVSAIATHTFNFPNSSASNRGLLTAADWTAFNSKEPFIAASNTIDQYWNGYKQFVALNTDSITEGATHLFFTQARARTSVSLTTSGSSGAATYNNTTGVFNIPNYSGGGGITQLFSKNNAISILGTDTVKMDTLKYSRIFNVKTYNSLAGDGQEVFDGVANGTTTFTVATGRFVASDVGKVIKIDSALTSNLDLVTTISAVTNSTTITLANAATGTKSGLHFEYGTDATTAIQAAINDCYSKGGGMVWLPVGMYMLNGPLQTSIGGVNPNCQLYITSPASSRDTTRTSIIVEGEAGPVYIGNDIINNVTYWPGKRGTVLVSCIDGSGTGPAVFGSKAPNTSFQNFSYTTAVFKNLTILTRINPAGAGPSVGGINYSYGTNLIVDQVLVSVDGIIFNEPQPTNDVCGIATPPLFDETMNVVTNSAVLGYTFGYVIGEHTELNQVQADACYYGFNFPQNEHATHGGRIETQWCSRDIVDITACGQTAGSTNFNITHLDVETALPDGHWYNQVYVVDDAGNNMTGYIGYHTVTGGSGAINMDFVKNGGNNVTAVRAISPFQDKIRFGDVATPTEQVEINVNQDASTFLDVTNGNAGTSAQAALRLSNGSSKVQAGILGTGSTPVGNIGSGDGYLYTNSGHMVHMVDNDTGRFSIAIGILPGEVYGFTKDTGSMGGRLSYTGNFAASFTDHSLIDKHFGDSAYGPGGPFHSIQVNSGGAFYGDGAFTRNESTGVLDMGGSADDMFDLQGSSATRVTMNIQATDAGSQSTLYMKNDRSGFLSYGGLLMAGSTNTNPLFGRSRADKLFLIMDGTNSLGGAIGTLTAQPLTLGTNNAEVLTLTGAGAVTAPFGTFPNQSGADSVLTTTTSAGVVTIGRKALSSIGGGVTTIGPFSGSSIANGASISGSTLTLGVGDGTNPGMVSTTTQTIAGNKIMTGLLDVGGSSASSGPRLFIEGNNTSDAASGSGRGFWLGIAQGVTNTAASGGTTATAGTLFVGDNIFASGTAGKVYTNAASLFVNGQPTAGANTTITNAWSLYVASGNSNFNGNVSTSGNGVVTSTHFIGNVPSGIAAGTGAGTAPTLTISGTDNDGSVTVLSGTTPSGAGATIATITYGFAFPANSFVTLTPANAITAALNGIGMVFTTASNTAWTITAGTTALTGATTYKWFYHVGGN